MCSHAIFFKSLCFGPFTLKRNPRVLKTKIESAALTKVFISEGQKCRNSIKDRCNCSKLCDLKLKRASVNVASEEHCAISFLNDKNLKYLLEKIKSKINDPFMKTAPSFLNK